LNSAIVYLQSNGYGPEGPSALRPSTHPIPGAAMGGVMYQMGGRVPHELQDMDGLRLWTRRLMRANEVNPDPNTAMVVLTSTMLGLVARQRTGQGQRILMDMFGANAWANHDDFLDYPGKSPRAKLDEQGHGFSPTWRLYRCAGDQWVFLGLLHERERRRFVSTLAKADVTCPDLESLAPDDAAKALAELFLKAPADEWQRRLAPFGLGCIRADRQLPAEFWLSDTQVEEMALTQPVTHPLWGEYRRHGAGVTFDGAQPGLKPPPLAGQHGEEILAALGYRADEIADLFKEGIVWRETASS
jgi:crotonobetainyl-CoA:carnitine CoA-transferase CaiB-like acyl-CoA transferase